VIKLLLLVVAGALFAPPAAIARDGRSGFSAVLQAQPMKKGPGPYHNGNGDKRVEHDKRQHKGRLTQEERRDLRRDLDRANREIYRR
jgi:hypothetical protein